MSLRLTRRGFVAAAGGLVAASLVPSALAARGDEFFLFIGLRGGLDGLGALPPVGDPGHRMTRGVFAPEAEHILPLDGFFGLHPSLAHLHQMFGVGDVSLHHAIGLKGVAADSHHLAWQALCEGAGFSAALPHIDAHSFPAAMAGIAAGWRRGALPARQGLAFGGWDMHAFAGGPDGLLARNLETLDRGLDILRQGLSPSLWSRTRIVVASEFGRHAGPNAQGGTEHGGAGAAFVLGGNVGSGRGRAAVATDWPGLRPWELEDGKLRITRDVRELFPAAAEETAQV